MLYAKYQFMCRLENEAVLPYYKGSTFRGVFGHALKRVVCALKREECGQCLLKERCVYALVFETPVALKSVQSSRTASPPHPFVIEPPLTTSTRFPEGASFDFQLLLFGDTNKNLPYFIYAFEQMGKIGIGKKVNGKRGRFVLKKVRCGEDIIYADIDQKLNMTSSVQTITLGPDESHSEKEFNLRLHLLTPLRLKFENRLKADLPFHVLVRAMLRRISTLFNTYGQGEPELDYRGLVKKAEQIKVAEADLRWFDLRRYSLRQDKAMLMGGMLGTITYHGDLNEYVPLIDLCSELHLGKQTSFGLGKIEAEVLK